MINKFDVDVNSLVDLDVLNKNCVNSVSNLVSNTTANNIKKESSILKKCNSHDISTIASYVKKYKNRNVLFENVLEQIDLNNNNNNNYNITKNSLKKENSKDINNKYNININIVNNYYKESNNFNKTDTSHKSNKIILNSQDSIVKKCNCNKNFNISNNNIQNSMSYFNSNGKLSETNVIKPSKRWRKLTNLIRTINYLNRHEAVPIQEIDIENNLQDYKIRLFPNSPIRTKNIKSAKKRRKQNNAKNNCNIIEYYRNSRKSSINSFDKNNSNQTKKNKLKPILKNFKISPLKANVKRNKSDEKQSVIECYAYEVTKKNNNNNNTNDKNKLYFNFNNNSSTKKLINENNLNDINLLKLSNKIKNDSNRNYFPKKLEDNNEYTINNIKVYDENNNLIQIEDNIDNKFNNNNNNKKISIKSNISDLNNKCLNEIKKNIVNNNSNYCYNSTDKKNVFLKAKKNQKTYLTSSYKLDIKNSSNLTKDNKTRNTKNNMYLTLRNNKNIKSSATSSLEDASNSGEISINESHDIIQDEMNKISFIEKIKNIILYGEEKCLSKLDSLFSAFEKELKINMIDIKIEDYFSNCYCGGMTFIYLAIREGKFNILKYFIEQKRLNFLIKSNVS